MYISSRFLKTIVPRGRRMINKIISNHIKSLIFVCHLNILHLRHIFDRNLIYLCGYRRKEYNNNNCGRKSSPCVLNRLNLQKNIFMQ